MTTEPFNLEAVRNPLALFNSVPLLGDPSRTSPLEVAVWRHKTLQELSTSLLAQFRKRHGDTLINEHIVRQFHATHWFGDTSAEKLAETMAGSVDALLKGILSVYVRSRDRMGVRRSLSVLESPHHDILRVLLAMRVCLLQVRLLDPDYAPNLQCVLDTIERALTDEPDKELFLRLTTYDCPASAAKVSVEEYVKDIHARVGILRGVDVHPFERLYLDLDKLVFNDFTLKEPSAAQFSPPPLPYAPPAQFAPQYAPALPPTVPAYTPHASPMQHEPMDIGAVVSALSTQVQALTVAVEGGKGPKGGQGRGGQGKGGGKGPRCFNCSGFGHIAKDCPSEGGGASSTPKK
jgi:hypothetical protein